MISCAVASRQHSSEYHLGGASSAFSYKPSASSNTLTDTYRHSVWADKSSSLSAALDTALTNAAAAAAGYSNNSKGDSMNSMGMGPGGYANYVPQLSHASSGFATQYGATELSHAYDSRHTGNSWYNPSTATDPTTRFNEYACKFTT